MTSPEYPIVVRRLSTADQTTLLDEIVACLAVAPFYRPTLPRWGTPFSVRMSNCGPLGWISDKSGYRYEPVHPAADRPWPPIPEMLMALWRDLAGYPHDPEACLINYYAPGAKMGLHQDKDEEDFAAPVLSVSLGDSARFRLGGLDRGDPIQSLKLTSGDVLILSGENRLAFHGVDKVYPGSSDLLSRHAGLFPEGGRLNLTLRRVTGPD